VRYVRRAFEDVGDLPFDTISVNLDWRRYFDRGESPTAAPPVSVSAWPPPVVAHADTEPRSGGVRGG
jgi:hypothetical protein